MSFEHSGIFEESSLLITVSTGVFIVHLKSLMRHKVGGPCVRVGWCVTGSASDDSLAQLL